MSPHAGILLALFAFAIFKLVRAWYRHDPNYVGWILLSIFSTIGVIASL